MATGHSRKRVRIELLFDLAEQRALPTVAGPALVPSTGTGTFLSDAGEGLTCLKVFSIESIVHLLGMFDKASETRDESLFVCGSCTLSDLISGLTQPCTCHRSATWLLVSGIKVYIYGLKVYIY